MRQIKIPDLASPRFKVKSFWSWGNMLALPQDVQDKIEATTRENLRPYQQGGSTLSPMKSYSGVRRSRHLSEPERDS